MHNLEKNASTTETGVPRDSNSPIKIILADDHKVVREGLRLLLEMEPRFSVIGEADGGKMVVQQVSELVPDVVIMDILMPGLNGIEATGQIKDKAPQVKVIALSMYSRLELVKRTLQAGAMGFLLKDQCTSKDLTSAVHSVMANQFYFSPGIAEEIAAELKRGTLAEIDEGGRALNIKQRELLQLLAEGKNTKQIAECLGLSPKTVDVYRRRLMDKLHLWSIAELTKHAIREGVTSLDF